MLLYKLQNGMILNVVGRVLSLEKELSFLSFGSYNTGSNLSWAVPPLSSSLGVVCGPPRARGVWEGGPPARPPSVIGLPGAC